MRRSIALRVGIVALVVGLVLPPLAPPTHAQVTPIPIGTVQGPVPQTTTCRQSRSPFAPPSGNSAGTTEVVIQGVIHQRTLARTSAGANQFHFFMQNTAATADGDPFTSDGIFVFLGSLPDMPRDDGVPGRYLPVVGDEVIIKGRVAEFFFLTQISSPRLVQVVRTGLDLDTVLPAFDAAPPDSFPAADCYWERGEGMRARVPADSVVVGRRQVFTSTLDGEVWVIRPDHPVAQRKEPSTRRVFRDPHPLDNIPTQVFDDGNGYRILLGSLGIKATAGINTALIAPARTFDRLSAAAVGAVYFAFNKYSVQVTQQIGLIPGADPSATGRLKAFERGEEYTVATFNVENLYDFRDDPFDGCDFAGNAGCPGVNPPFDYVPASDAEYQRQLEGLATQIIYDMRAPDIIMVQEAEDQDICTVVAGALTCGATNNADGKPDTLQELALVIERLGGPRYDAASDRDGADDRGIVSGHLYRTDRVELVPPDVADPVLGMSPLVQYRVAGAPYNTEVQNPKALNAPLPADVDRSTGVDGTNVFTRPPQVALFRIWRARKGASAFTLLYVISNHFSSGPDIRVGQRKEQAAYNAAIVAALKQTNPDVRVVVGGDLNVFPRPDDPFAPGHVQFPSDQLAALYAQSLTNVWDRLVAEAPESAYSYVFDGQTQTLDSFFLTGSVLAEFRGVAAIHVNSDWPVEFDGDGARGISDHDPVVARLRALTVDGLVALLWYLRSTGAITTREATLALQEYLLRARQYAAEGQWSSYADQLRRFIAEVERLAPGTVTRPAADALQKEAAILAWMR
jgi:hypothetical protein